MATVPRAGGGSGAPAGSVHTVRSPPWCRGRGTGTSPPAPDCGCSRGAHRLAGCPGRERRLRARRPVPRPVLPPVGRLRHLLGDRRDQAEDGERSSENRQRCRRARTADAVARCTERQRTGTRQQTCRTGPSPCAPPGQRCSARCVDGPDVSRPRAHRRTSPPDAEGSVDDDDRQLRHAHQDERARRPPGCGRLIATMTWPGDGPVRPPR